MAVTGESGKLRRSTQHRKGLTEDATAAHAEVSHVTRADSITQSKPPPASPREIAAARVAVAEIKARQRAVMSNTEPEKPVGVNEVLNAMTDAALHSSAAMIEEARIEELRKRPPRNTLNKQGSNLVQQVFSPLTAAAMLVVPVDQRNGRPAGRESNDKQGVWL